MGVTRMCTEPTPTQAQPDSNRTRRHSRSEHESVQAPLLQRIAARLAQDPTPRPSPPVTSACSCPGRTRAKRTGLDPAPPQTAARVRSPRRAPAGAVPPTTPQRRDTGARPRRAAHRAGARALGSARPPARMREPCLTRCAPRRLRSRARVARHAVAQGRRRPPPAALKRVRRGSARRYAAYRTQHPPCTALRRAQRPRARVRASESWGD
jgi:hypothetical protein